MGSSYGQFCPVAKAMELLDERWTLLVVRELVAGSQHFNELRRGVPGMSPTLLSKRLGQLVRAGVVERQDDAGEVRYVLTPAGRELRPVVEALGSGAVTIHGPEMMRRALPRWSRCQYSPRYPDRYGERPFSGSRGGRQLRKLWLSPGKRWSR